MTSLRRATFPEATIVRLSPGTLERVRQVAEQDGTTSAELMRQAIRRAVEKQALAIPATHNATRSGFRYGTSNPLQCGAPWLALTVCRAAMGSAKIRRRQSIMVQRKRRARMVTTTRRPCDGRSVSVRR